MALINLSLLANTTTVLDETSASSGDVVAVQAIGTSSTLLISNVDITITSIAGVVAGAAPTFASTNNGTLTINQGLLNIQALSSLNFDIIGNGNIVLDGSTISTGLTNLLTSYNVQYDGQRLGSFLYKPSTLSLLNPVTFNVGDMQAGDEFNVGANRTWSLATTTLGGPRTAYRSGALHLRSGGGLLGQTVNVVIPMTQAEANTFFAAQAQYLNPTAGVFIFPGEIVCFAEGSLLLTVDGYRPVENLVVGDMLKLADGRRERIRWIGSSALDEEALDLLPNLRPIRLRKDCLAKGYPFADLVVSPQHRIWVNGGPILELTDGVGGLIAAKHLLGIDGVEVAHDMTSVRYYHVLLDSHEILWSNGLPTESLLIGKHMSTHLAPTLRRDILRMLPEAERMFIGDGGESKHHLLQGKVARLFAKREVHCAKSYFDATQLGRICNRKIELSRFGLWRELTIEVDIQPALTQNKVNDSFYAMSLT